ncbi:esterase-like activity of phytase family protein [Acinetobacter sp. WZC-1]|uniref:esterase-like activity of phytase family protein n=1 Tax=Acinetobacter sp. WZC-1 TaxID=3459034 RepID=UPI00403DC701
MNRLFLIGAFALTLSVSACNSDDTDQSIVPPSQPPASQTSVSDLNFLGELVISNDLKIGNDPVGGLSGLDYRAADNSWYLISDDRSSLAPARFFTANLNYDLNGFHSVSLNKSVYLKDQNQQNFPDSETGDLVVDPESIRVDPVEADRLWWTSEGDKKLGLNPFVAQMNMDGTLIRQLPALPLFNMYPDETRGSRNNATYEGLSLSADGQSIWTSMEGPIYEDGELPTTTTPAVIRLSQFDRDGKLIHQYAYSLDSIPGTASEIKSADNGVSEILAIDDQHLLFVERASIQNHAGIYTNSIRIYKVSLDNATDIANYSSLQNQSYRTLNKTLIYNLDRAGLQKIDNIEGISWGPVLSNGHRSLVLVSDNNFNMQSQITQLLAFEVLP